MKRYQKAKNTVHRKKQDEKNDCSVIATSIVCRTTYKEAHAACAAHGRKSKQGMYTSSILKAIRSLGFSVEPVKRLKQKNGSRFTPKTIGDKLKRGYYICSCNDHVFAVVNGDVEDWTEGRKHYINEAYKIVRTRSN